jgi:hypothetical protein
MPDILATFRRHESVINAATMAFERAVQLDQRPAAVAEALEAIGSPFLSRVWPIIAPHTMCDVFRAASLVRRAEEALALPGDFIECGVAGGGFSLLLGLLVKEHGANRTVWMCDSFEGLPAPDRMYDRGYDEGEFRHGQSEVEALMKAHGVDGICRTVPGWFSDTLPGLLAGRRLALAHIDGDLHSSCRDALRCIYPAMLPGGAIIADDYLDGSGGALAALNAYVAESGEPIRIGPCSQVTVIVGEGAGADAFEMAFDARGRPGRGGATVRWTFADIEAFPAYLDFLNGVANHWAHRVDLFQAFVGERMGHRG